MSENNPAQTILESTATTALAEYDLPGPLYVAPIRVLNNSVHEVIAGDGSRYALRVHRPGARCSDHTLAELTFLADVHARLASERITVPTPVPAADGRLLVSLTLPQETTSDAHVEAHCDLLTWVDGKVRRPGSGLGARGVYQLGRALAQLHHVAENYAPAMGFTLPTWDAAGMFTAERSPYNSGPIGEFLRGEDLALFQEVAEQTAAVFSALGNGGESFGLIHNDFILGNCHTVRRRPYSWDVGVLDFDDCGWGHYLYDLAPVMGNLSDYAHFEELKRAFLTGYRIVRPLPEDLETHLPVLMAARHASQCLWAAGLARRPGVQELDTTAHITYRMAEVRRCLALGRR
ncbi:phosphotransferase enzyme family protein [Glycomyces harbinensis]|uniref:Ser/Thr protein kinase RdoA involved in Cpx stress response, MazF antagonist n=1 Tax=Glycomyces harbinensis TaxID=58114 RepID=A0A1G6W3R8_9ACTN|nr:phosphotransferase [Glycomyces harbinensis]SDD59857.1 Ser/Thr protein kinase RdoA involved in Cpx stress response, MazF antagonist [Glycomyces harbinensis]